MVLVEAIFSILDVLKLPFEKELASDELSQVPNMPLVFNSLSQLIKLEIPVAADEDIPPADVEFLLQVEQVQIEICNTISAIAQEGVEDIKE